MTWYIELESGDVFDHEGKRVATIDAPYTIPDDVHDVMMDEMEGNQPSSYNQSLIADAATNNIERGTPP